MNDLSEKEQLEAVRAWWAENGNYVMGGIFVGIVIIFAWNQWQSNVAESRIEASAMFEDVMEAAARNDLDAATTAAADLFAEHDDTPYAAQTRLALARMYMDNGRDADAASALREVVEADADSELSHVARLRLAKILLYQDKAEEVVELLSGRPESAFSARFNEVLGDAYAALGQYPQAEAAYLAALNDDPAARTVDVNLVQLKINDLPLLDGAKAAPEPEVDAPADAAGEEGAEPAAQDSEAAAGDAGGAEPVQTGPVEDGPETE